MNNSDYVALKFSLEIIEIRAHQWTLLFQKLLEAWAQLLTKFCCNRLNNNDCTALILCLEEIRAHQWTLIISKGVGTRVHEIA